MNDTFFEQLIKRTPSFWAWPIRVLVIFGVLAIFFVGTPIIGPIAFILAAGLAFAAYYFIFPRLNVEYEYAIANHDMEIAAIYNKASRKEKFNFDIREVDFIAPKNSPKLHNASSMKVYDYTSGTGDAGVYGVVTAVGSQKVCLYIEPDERILKSLKDWAGTKMDMK